MKHKIEKLLFASVAGFTSFMALGWKFYDLTVRTHARTTPSMHSVTDAGAKSDPSAGSNLAAKKKPIPFSHITANHPRNGYQEIYEQGKVWCRQQRMQDWYLRSFDNLLLHARYFPTENAKRTVLLSHGYKGSGFGDFANTARFLHENGCNLLFIDQRCHGKSEGDSVTFGALEQRDVADWMKKISENNQEHLPLYLFGTSMGASTVLMASGHKLPSETKGIIADCGFRSMKGQLEDMASNWFHLHRIPLLLFRVDLFCRLFSGFSIKEADTSAALQKNKLPVLFFHGGRDTFVYFKNTQYNYRICTAPKEMVLIPNARHLCCAYADEDLYRRKLLRFFEKYDH